MAGSQPPVLPPAAGLAGLAHVRTNAAAGGAATCSRRHSPLPSPRSPAHPCTFRNLPPSSTPAPAPSHAGSDACGDASAHQLRARSTSISTTAASTAGGTTTASSYLSISSFSASASTSSSVLRPIGVLSAHLRQGGRGASDSAPTAANGLHHGVNRDSGSDSLGRRRLLADGVLADGDEAVAPWMGMSDLKTSPSAAVEQQQQQQRKQPWLPQEPEQGPRADGAESAADEGVASGSDAGISAALLPASRRHRSMSCTGSHNGGIGSNSCGSLSAMGSSGGVRASRSRASVVGGGGSSSKSMLAVAEALPPPKQQELEQQHQQQQRRISQTVVASGPVPPLLALRQVLSGKNLSATRGTGAEPLICQRNSSQNGSGVAGGGISASGLADSYAGTGSGACQNTSRRTSSHRSRRGDKGSEASGLAPLSPGRLSPAGKQGRTGG